MLLVRRSVQVSTPGDGMRGVASSSSLVIVQPDPADRVPGSPPLYAPSRTELLRLARNAPLTNPQDRARDELVAKLSDAQGDFASRIDWHVPGLVYGVESDTCMTGREVAPANIAYDEYGAEFIFRQPRDESELVAVLGADSVEVYGCYRFDGLEQWTEQLVRHWITNVPAIEARLDLAMESSDIPEIAAGARAYRSYLASDEFARYVDALLHHLARRRLPPRDAHDAGPSTGTLDARRIRR